MTAANTDVQSALSQVVVETFLAPLPPGTRVEMGALESNYYSFTFPIDAVSIVGRRGVYVKIPKADLRTAGPEILPVTDADRRLAEEEIRSLQQLADEWQADDLGVRFVALRGFLPEYNAVITDRAYARHACDVLRRDDLRRRFGRPSAARALRDVMARLGAALGRFHQRSAVRSEFSGERLVPKLQRYADELAVMTRSPWPGRLATAFSGIGRRRIQALRTTTLKGIDVRNILIDERSQVFLLDPGRAKVTFREADLARFLLTYRILFWGSPLFGARLQPDRVAEERFLSAYYRESGPPSEGLLTVFLLKEILKHWHTAHLSLRLKPWRSSVRRIVAATYIDPFYARQTAGVAPQLSS